MNYIIISKKSITANYLNSILKKIYKITPSVLNENNNLIKTAILNVINDMFKTGLGKRKLEKYYPNFNNTELDFFRNNWNSLNSNKKDSLLDTAINNFSI